MTPFLLIFMLRDDTQWAPRNLLGGTSLCLGSLKVWTEWEGLLLWWVSGWVSTVLSPPGQREATGAGRAACNLSRKLSGQGLPFRPLRLRISTATWWRRLAVSDASRSRVGPWRNTHRGEEAWPPVWDLRLEVKPKGSLTGREDKRGLGWRQPPGRGLGQPPGRGLASNSGRRRWQPTHYLFWTTSSPQVCGLQEAEPVASTTGREAARAVCVCVSGLTQLMSARAHLQAHAPHVPQPSGNQLPPCPCCRWGTACGRYHQPQSTSSWGPQLLPTHAD